MDLATVALLAKYNAHANREMGRILSTLTEEEWNREFPGHFRSVHELCAHVLKADILWLRRFTRIKDFSFAGDELLAREYSSQDPFPTMEAYFDERLRLDDAFLSFSGELRQADLPSMLAFTTVRGEKQERKVGALALHCFNHQTHHRAMVSLYLEFMGKDNDFSALYPIA